MLSCFMNTHVFAEGLLHAGHWCGAGGEAAWTAQGKSSVVSERPEGTCGALETGRRLGFSWEGRSWEEWSDSGFVLEAELMAFADGIEYGVEKR